MEKREIADPRSWYTMVATLLGLGAYSNMPGTLGTLAAALIALFMGDIPILLLAAVIVVGTIASGRYARAAGKEDPSEVVIDEVAGYWIALIGLGASYAVAAFFLFRIVDILKPFPVRTMERLPGGIGIMADDICGGAMVNILMRLIVWFFYRGGIADIQSWLGVGV